MVGMQKGTDTSEDRLAVSYKANILLPYDPAITLLSFYPGELKIYIHTKICMQMFTAALFVTAKAWKQSRYPSSK